MIPDVVRYWVAGLALAAAAIWLATDQVVTTWVVDGTSMVPTLEPGDRILIDRWTYRQRRPRPGEIVVVEAMDSQVWVKRVAEVRDGGEALWLLGDNPPASLDSRRLGTLAAEGVWGRVRWRYWPLARAGRVR